MSMIENLVRSFSTIGRSDDSNTPPNPQDWVKRLPVAGAPDKYALFENIHTGVRLWERPKGLSGEEDIRTIYTFKETQSLEEILKHIGALSSGPGKAPKLLMEASRKLKSKEVFNQYDSVLVELLILFESLGDELEWKKILNHESREVVKTVCVFLKCDITASHTLFTTACDLISGFIAIDSKLLMAHVQEDEETIFDYIVSALELSVSSLSDEELYPHWLTMMIRTLANVNILHSKWMPTRRLIEVTCAALNSRRLEIFPLAIESLALINAYCVPKAQLRAPTLKDGLRPWRESSDSMVLIVLKENPRVSEAFGEGLLQLLNDETNSSDIHKRNIHLLRIVCSLFTCTPNYRNFFHASDFRVLVDILLKQIENMSLDDEGLVFCVTALIFIFQNSSIKKEYPAKTIHKILVPKVKDATQNCAHSKVVVLLEKLLSSSLR